MFLDIISAEDGIEQIMTEQIGDEVIHYYTGKLSDDPVIISATTEFLTNRTAKEYMRQLGIDELIISLFPSDESLPPLSS